LKNESGEELGRENTKYELEKFTDVHSTEV